MLGAILAATDAVAVVALLKELGSSAALATLIESESLLNDGSAFVVYLLTQSILLGGDSSVRAIVGNLFQYALGGPAFGLACGIATIAWMNSVYDDAEVEISITIGAVYVCFWVADSPLGISAVLAVVVMGVYFSKHRYAVSPSVQPNLAAVWALLIFAVNVFVFVLSGLIISAKLIWSSDNIRGVDVAWLFLLYALLHVVRFLSVLVFLPLFRRTNVHLTLREVVMITWSGMRGGVSLLLGLITYLQPAYDEVFRDRLMFHVCGIVLLTLVVNGMTSRYVLQALQLHKGTAESRLVLRSALDHMRQQTAQAMREMRGDAKFRNVEWTVLRPFLPAALISEVQQRDEQLQEEERQAQEQRRVERRLLERQQTQQRKPVVTFGQSDAPGGAELTSAAQGVDMDEEQLRDLIFPPDHPIHRIVVDEDPHSKGAEPGDLTLMNMPTLQYQQIMGAPQPAPDRGDDEDLGVDVPAAPSRQRTGSRDAVAVDDGGIHVVLPPTHALTVASDGRPSPVTRQSTRHVAHRSSLMSIFDEPDAKESAADDDPQPSPSRDTLASHAPLTRPPAGPAVPGAPPQPPRSPHRPPPLMRTTSPRETKPGHRRWGVPLMSAASRRVLSPLRPPAPVSVRHRQRRYLHHRQMSSAGDIHFAQSALAEVDAAKRSLHRELSVRFITALQSDYHRQFAAGLVTRRSLRVLTAACDHGMDEGSIVAHWEFIHRQLRCPRWLSLLYSWRALSRVDGSRWVRPLRALVQHLMFSHLKVSVELATAFLSAQQRLEFVLDDFPEFTSIDAEVIAAVQRQAGALQSRALTVWVDVTEGYHEAHAAVVTRHAAVLLLHFQQSEIRSLHATGMLEQREFDGIIALINGKLLRLERTGIRIPFSSARDLLLSLPIMISLTAQQQRALRTEMQAKGTRQWYENHQTLWDRRQKPPGLVILVRGTLRVMYEYQTEEEEEQMEDAQQEKREPNALPSATPAMPPLRSLRSLGSSVTRQRHERFHLHDTVGRGGLVGAFEMLTGHSTLGVCSTVTMAEAFVLDRACVDLLMEEDDAFVLLARAAAEALLKAQWRRWAVHEQTRGLKEYQLQQLVQRAHATRTIAAPHALDVRYADVVLLLTGAALGRGVKRKVKRRRSTRAAQLAAATARTAAASGPAPSRVTGSSPTYNGPCWLRHRAGRLELSPGCMYLTWSLRDEEIAALFPPPPRADMKSYAKELGLTMRLAQQHAAGLGHQHGHTAEPGNGAQSGREGGRRDEARLSRPSDGPPTKPPLEDPAADSTTATVDAVPIGSGVASSSSRSTSILSPAAAAAPLLLSKPSPSSSSSSTLPPMSRTSLTSTLRPSHHASGSAARLGPYMGAVRRGSLDGGSAGVRQQHGQHPPRSPPQPSHDRGRASSPPAVLSAERKDGEQRGAGDSDSDGEEMEEVEEDELAFDPQSDGGWDAGITEGERGLRGVGDAAQPAGHSHTHTHAMLALEIEERNARTV